MIRVVLDTNVVVSALFSPAGLEDRVLKHGLHRFMQLYVSSPVLAEYERVLSSSKFGFRPVRVRAIVRRIAGCAHSVRPMRLLAECRDDAVAAGADFLITGNKRHFPAQ